MAQSSITIDPDRQTGATVRYFGWDAKLSANVSSSSKAAKWLYGESPANLIRHQMIKSMLYGSCVQTSGSYLAKDNPPDKVVAQATRVGDTVWLWLFNPGRAIDKLPVKFSSGAIESFKAGYWTGGKKVTPETVGELTVSRAGQDQLAIAQVPALSVTLLEVQLEDDGMLLPVKKWQLLKPRKKTLEASLTKVTGKTLYFETGQGKTVKVSGKDISPDHHQEIRDAMRAHGQL